MNTGVIFIVFQILDLLIDDVFAVNVFTRFVPSDPELNISGSSLVYCDDRTVSWDIYCVGYQFDNNPGLSASELVFQRPGSTEEVELATVLPSPFTGAVNPVIDPAAGCLDVGSYHTSNPPNLSPLIDGQTTSPFYIKYQFSGCKKEHAGVYNCKMEDLDTSTNSFTGSTEPNGPFSVTFAESACKSDDENETGNSATDPPGNNASKPTGYPVITLVGIVTITMIN